MGNSGVDSRAARRLLRRGNPLGAEAFVRALGPQIYAAALTVTGRQDAAEQVARNFFLDCFRAAAAPGMPARAPAS